MQEFERVLIDIARRMTSPVRAPCVPRAAGALLLLVVVAASPSFAQAPVTRVYLPNPADEDWSFLKQPGTHIDRWDGWKYIPFGDDGYLTLSGEARYRPEGLRIRGVEPRPTTTDNYFLQRYLFGADLHFGQRFRAFGELQAGIINGKLGSPRPTDRDTLDLHQAFVEVATGPVRNRTFLARVGRQELSIGSSRLISASPGLNVKRSFDGITVLYRRSGWTTVASLSQLVGLNPGAFDDRATREQLFWGAAAGRRSPRFDRGELGVYYLGIDRHRSLYAQGIGPETRHTVGLKWSGTGARLDLNYDAVFQWGRFAEAPIRAWAFATETGYRFPSSSWAPRVSLRGDFASGDERASDAALQSFNPLFPGNSYSGSVGLLGPTNLTDVTPALTVRPRGTLVVTIEAPSYWRTSAGDGVYATDQRVLLPPTAGQAKYVGTNPGVVVVWQLTRHLQAQGAITRFISGGFLERTFVAKGFGFYSVTALYRF